MIILIIMIILIVMIILIIMIILNQVKTALVNKDLKKAGEMEIKKLDQLLSQVLTIIIFMVMLWTKFILVKLHDLICDE